MKRYIMMSLLVLSLLVTGIGTASAQGVDQAMLTIVSDAFTATRGVDSLQIVTQSLMESSAQEASISGQTMQTIDLARTETGWNTQATTTTITTLPFGTLEIGVEVIIIDGVTWLRFANLPEQLPLELPQDWVTLEELEASFNESSGQGGVAAFGLQAGLTQDALLGALNLPLSAESVTEISALPDDAIDGAAMRVYQLSLDPAAVLENEAASLLNTPAGGAPVALPEGFTPPEGVQAPEQLPADIATPTPESFQVTLAVYIGAEDGLIHRVYLVINIAGSIDGSTPAFTITSISDYRNFGEPVEISAPVIGG